MKFLGFREALQLLAVTTSISSVIITLLVLYSKCSNTAEKKFFCKVLLELKHVNRTDCAETSNDHIHIWRNAGKIESGYKKCLRGDPFTAQISCSVFLLYKFIAST
jgi:hypothetical protein